MQYELEVCIGNGNSGFPFVPRENAVIWERDWEWELTHVNGNRQSW